jgi:hypothetical protein
MAPDEMKILELLASMNIAMDERFPSTFPMRALAFVLETIIDTMHVLEHH